MQSRNNIVIGHIRDYCQSGKLFAGLMVAVIVLSNYAKLKADFNCLKAAKNRKTIRQLKRSDSNFDKSVIVRDENEQIKD